MLVTQHDDPTSKYGDGWNAFIVVVSFISFCFSLTSVFSFLHHFYPAYDASIANYALKLSKEDGKSKKSSSSSSANPPTTTEELAPPSLPDPSAPLENFFQ